MLAEEQRGEQRVGRLFEVALFNSGFRKSREGVRGGPQRNEIDGRKLEVEGGVRRDKERLLRGVPNLTCEMAHLLKSLLIVWVLLKRLMVDRTAEGGATVVRPSTHRLFSVGVFLILDSMTPPVG